MDEDFVSFNDQQDSSNNDASISAAPEAPALVTTIPAPWLAFGSIGNANEVPPFVRFHNEILTFCEYIAPSSDELRMRDDLLKEVTDVIRTVWPDPSVEVHVFGSQLTKILTPTSDLDIAVLNVPRELAAHPNAMYLKLANAFKVTGRVSYVEAIINAKVPIVKLDHIETGLSVDICINNDSGLKTGALIRKFVRQYPPLRPLTLVMKVFLSQRRLNETYTGGIGSFMLIEMIVSFLQMTQRLASFTQAAPSWNLAALLLEFFKLYGSTFNYYLTGISVANGGRYLKKRKIDGHDSYNQSNQRHSLLYIENADDPSADVGRNSYMVPKIRKSFEHAHTVLTTVLCGHSVPSYLAYVIRTDDPTLQDRPAPDLHSQRSNADAIK